MQGARAPKVDHPILDLPYRPSALALKAPTNWLAGTKSRRLQTLRQQPIIQDGMKDEFSKGWSSDWTVDTWCVMAYVVLPVRESNSDKAPMQTLLAVTSQCFEFHSLVRLSFLSSVRLFTFSWRSRSEP